MVHCLAGVSRSVCLVLAYFIKCKGFSYEESYNLVKIKRSIVIIYLHRFILIRDLQLNLKNMKEKFEEQEARLDIKQYHRQPKEDMNIIVKIQFVITLNLLIVLNLKPIFPLLNELQFRIMLINHLQRKISNNLQTKVMKILPVSCMALQLKEEIFNSNQNKFLLFIKHPAAWL